MSSVVMPSVIMPSVVMPSAVMPSIVRHSFEELQTRLEMLARDEYIRLIGISASDDEKKFHNMDQRLKPTPGQSLPSAEGSSTASPSQQTKSFSDRTRWGVTSAVASAKTATFSTTKTTSTLCTTGRLQTQKNFTDRLLSGTPSFFIIISFYDTRQYL